MVQEPGFRNAGVMEIRDRKLADTEIPVRMASPLDVQIVAEVESRLDAFALQLLETGAEERNIVRDAIDDDSVARGLRILTPR